MDNLQNLPLFLAQLRKLDIQLTVEDGRLVCSAPKGVLTAELKEQLKARKGEILEFLSGRSSTVEVPRIEHLGSEGLLPPSLAQQRLWFLEQFDPGGTAYTISFALIFKGSLNKGALEESLREIIRRHEVLRTCLVDVEGSPRAIVQPLGDWSMEEIQSAVDLTPAEQIDELKRTGAVRAQRHFELSQSPLLRACLVVFGGEDYGFFLEVHHICCDGWSLGVLTEELTELYSAHCTGRQANLPQLSIQYADYARWHRAYIEHDAMRSQTSYWLRKLAGPLATIDLPCDRPRPPVVTSRGAISPQRLPLELFDSVKRFGLSENVTPFIVMMAAFKVLLFRYTGQNDVIVGSASAGRNRPELERLIGLFVNSLVLRTDVSGDPTVRELLGRVRQTSLEAFEHEDVPFDRLAEILPSTRDLSRSPMFQVMFILQNFPMRKLNLPGLATTILEIGTENSRYDLTIEAFEIDDQLRLHWTYNTDLFDAATIGRMQRHYQRLLESMLVSPATRISKLELLNHEEVAGFLLSSQESKRNYPHDLCIHEWFEQQAAQTPDAIAVVCGENELTYGELSIGSNRLAHWLREAAKGVEPLVGLCLERTADMAVALLAILKSGCAYLPIDPQYPKDRIAFMLEDSGASILVTTEQLQSIVPARGPRVICLDRDREILFQQSSAICDGGATPDSLAYVIYTSGSTGKPKGVEITHRSVVNFLSSMQREPRINNGDRLLAVTTLCFDIAGLEFYLPLLSGAKLIIAPRTAVADGDALMRLIETSGATIMQATPATWRLLLDSGWRGTKELKILCGGEVLPRELANRLLACGRELWNLYGPTETTIWSTIHAVDSRPGAVPIGKPIDNTEVYILDENGSLVPPGVIGELYIGGLGVARGYRGRAELTAEKFIQSPFHGGSRIYRTGDLARWMPDGNLECLGRRDNQVKVRGYRIELGEIEAVLEQQPGVKQAVAMVREDVPGDQRLAAYLVTTGELGDTQYWRELLRSKLPDYMIPSTFMRLHSFPLTPNRKVDRKLLPAAAGDTFSSNAYAPPGTETEKQVATIWKDLLRTAQVGLHDRFFDLGGHSLLVVQLQSRLRQHFQVDVSLVELFQRPTVATMASLITETGIHEVNHK